MRRKEAEPTGVTFNIALNYGGRNEILTAVKKIANKVKNGELDIETTLQKQFQIIYIQKES